MLESKQYLKLNQISCYHLVQIYFDQDFNILQKWSWIITNKTLNWIKANSMIYTPIMFCPLTVFYIHFKKQQKLKMHDSSLISADCADQCSALFVAPTILQISHSKNYGRHLIEFSLPFPLVPSFPATRQNFGQIPQSSIFLRHLKSFFNLCFTFDLWYLIGPAKISMRGTDSNRLTQIKTERMR